MPTSPATNTGTSAVWPACRVTGWLVLAASPTFALMAGVAASDTAPMPFCSATPGILPINSMTAMYLLMSVFHLAPWLKLAAARRWARV